MTDRMDRPSARVVVIDETGCVLLFRIDDPYDTKPAVWITPVGGIEPGETVVEAASRELFEETGIHAGDEDLGAPVAVFCRAEWVFRGVPAGRDPAPSAAPGSRWQHGRLMVGAVRNRDV